MAAEKSGRSEASANWFDVRAVNLGVRGKSAGAFYLTFLIKCCKQYKVV